MKSYRIMFWLFLIMSLTADRLTKWLVLSDLNEGQSVPVIKDIFHITLVKNTGLAFGLLQGPYSYIFAVISVIMTIAIFFLYFSKKPSGYLINSAMGLLCAGALGNLIDRLMYGRVIDFLDFRFWPVFNIADSSIFLGVAIFILVYTFFYENLRFNS